MGVHTDPNALNLPWVDSPFFDSLLTERPLSDFEKRLALQYRERGYAILEEPVVALDVIERAIADLDGRYTDSPTGYANANRAMDAWHWSEAVTEIARAPRVLDALRVFYQREPIPFQTLNFSIGTEQLAHSDTIHFHSVPQRFMAGVWVALEDVHPDSGPLFVHPGSHRLPIFDLHALGLDTGFENYPAYERIVGELLDAAKIEPEPLSIRKGQAIIWAANLFHGGSAIRDSARTRLSQASHYFFEDCLYYQPAASDPFVGSMRLKKVEEVGTRRAVPNLYRSRPIDQRRLAPRRHWRSVIRDWISLRIRP